MNEKAMIVVEQSMPQFQKITRANNGLVEWEEEKQFAIQALQKNQFLAKCAPHTIQNSIINIASVGLTLNPADGYAYLVPEYNKQTKANECMLRISFKGLIKVATDTGQIDWVKADTVKKNDEFEYCGAWELPTHKMDPFSDRGDLVGVYCVAKLSSGGHLTDVMSWEEVMKIKGCAKTTMVWDKWPEEMAKKAVIKRAAKQWPKTNLTSRLNKTIEVMNDGEGSEDPLVQIEKTAQYILECIDNGDDDSLREAWTELDETEQSQLWTAKTKGGFFSGDDKLKIRSALAKPVEEVDPE